MQYQSVSLAPSRKGAAAENAAPRYSLEQKYIFPHVQFFAAHLVDGEHVEICDVVLLGVLDPRPALLLVYQLSDVLVHKFALFEKRHVRPATTSDDPRVFVLAKVPLK